MVGPVPDNPVEFVSKIVDTGIDRDYPGLHPIFGLGNLESWQTQKVEKLLNLTQSVENIVGPYYEWYIEQLNNYYDEHDEPMPEWVSDNDKSRCGKIFHHPAAAMVLVSNSKEAHLQNNIMTQRYEELLRTEGHNMGEAQGGGWAMGRKKRKKKKRY